MNYIEEKLMQKESENIIAGTALEILDTVSTDINVHPDDFLFEFGLEKAAEYLDEFAKEAAPKAGLWNDVTKFMYPKPMGEKSVNFKGKGSTKNVNFKPTKKLQKDVNKPSLMELLDYHKRPLIAGAGALGVAGAGYALGKNRNEKDASASYSEYLDILLKEAAKGKSSHTVNFKGDKKAPKGMSFKANEKLNKAVSKAPKKESIGQKIKKKLYPEPLPEKTVKFTRGKGTPRGMGFEPSKKLSKSVAKPSLMELIKYHKNPLMIGGGLLAAGGAGYGIKKYLDSKNDEKQASGSYADSLVAMAKEKLYAQ